MQMTFDIIILAYSKTPKQKQTTQDCVDSLLKAKNKVKVNIIVLEGYDQAVGFVGTTKIFFQEEEFNYNRSMNEGFKYSTNKYVFFCNNDLIFNDGWADACLDVFNMGYKSLSPYCPVTHPQFVKDGDYIVVGYQVGFHVAGWCIGVDRDMFKALGGFNDKVRFWYSDNIYAEQLKIADVKHALVCNAYVKHLDFGSKTLNSLNPREKYKLTSAQTNMYNKEVGRLWNAKKKEVLR